MATSIPPLDWQPPAPKAGGLGERITNGLLWVISQLYEHTAEPMVKLGVKLAGDILEDIGKDIAAPVKQSILRMAETPGLEDHHKAILTALGEAHSVTDILVGIPYGIMVLLGLTGGGLAPLGNLARYEMDKRLFTARISPLDSWRALRLGSYSQDRYERNMFEQGFDVQDAFALEQLAYAQPSTVEVREQLYRGVITQDEAFSKLQHIGYSDEQAERLLKIFPLLPGISDMIRFQVREVFSPEIAAKFGQYDEEPTGIYEHTRKLGLDDEWVQRYWAAHWELPSLTQGYEMFHRIDPETGQPLIDEGTLRELMRAQDVMPYWRDKLIKINFSPLTRVDVRRMYRDGAIGLEEVYRVYRNLGYNDNDARMLTDWVQKMKNSVNKELSKTDVLDGYMEGLLSVEETSSALEAIGYDANETEFYLARADYLLAKAQASEQVGLIEQQFKSGLITETQATDQLTKLNLPDRKVQTNILKWRRSISVKTKTPSIDQLGNFLRVGSISEGEYRAELDKMGYNARYVEMFLREVKPSLTISQLMTLFKQREISEGDFTAKMTAEGYTPDQINTFIKQLTPEPSLSQLQSFLRKGAMSEPEFRAELLRRGYSPQYVDAFTQVSAPTPPKPPVAKIATVSLAQLGGMFNEKIIDEPTYRQELKERGYKDTDIARLVKLNQPPAAAGATRLSLGQISTFFRELVINEAEYRFRLGQLGYSQPDIDKIVLVNSPTRPAGSAEPTIGDLNKWLVSGIIDETTYRQRLAAKGYSPEDIDNYVLKNLPTEEA